jgi:hypothetical protein
LYGAPNGANRLFYVIVAIKISLLTELRIRRLPLRVDLSQVERDGQSSCR